MSSPTFTRREVQDMLDAAQLKAGILFADIVSLRDQLQVLFQENFMACNLQDVDAMKLLRQVLCIERTILDAYNRHRLGNAVTAFNGHYLDPENTVEYNEEDSIPEKLKWFPLRATVARRGVHILLPPIYQFKVASKKTANSKSSVKGKKATGFGSQSYNKLRDAPSAWLDLPRGNLTLAEMTAFIPHAIKSYDIIDRFLYNGALSRTFADMINQYRDMPFGRIKNNSIYRMMKGPMDHRAKNDSTYEEWTVAKHAAIPKPAGFDPTSVSVAGFGTPVHLKSRELAAVATQAPPSILFRDMANGVKVMPSGYDALDLTRCVEYCVKHNSGSWRYPQDFEKLVAHLGGAAVVFTGHQDHAAILRHTSKKKRMNAKRAGAQQRDYHGRLLKQKKRFVVDSKEEAVGEDFGVESEEDLGDLNSDEDDSMPQIRSSPKRKRTAISDDDDYAETPSRRTPKRNKKLPLKTHARRSKRASPSRLRKEVLPEDIDSESVAYAGPKRRNKKAVVATRFSARTKRFNGSYNVEKLLEVEEEEEDEENEEGEDEDECEGEAEMEDTPNLKKQFSTPVQMRMVGRKQDTDANDAVEDESDIETTDEDASGDDDDLDL